LPKLLLFRSVEEGKVSNMVDEHVAQQRQLRVLWCDLAGI
jgi:hypothetical protein